MRTFLIGGLVLGLLSPAAAVAQSPFDGTWKGDVASAQLPRKPLVYLLRDGMYACKTCVPPISIKADGTDQPVTGNPYFDSDAIKIVDDRTVQGTIKRNGKVVGTSTTTVAPDGKSETYEFTNSTASSGAPVIGKIIRTRVGPAPAGAHAISGSWRATAASAISDNGTTFSYKVDGDNLGMTNPTGQQYSAKMDGTEAPYTGDPGITSVSVRKLGEREIEETDKRAGKAISVTTSTVSPDGKTMSVVIRDKLRGTTFKFTADKQ